MSPILLMAIFLCYSTLGRADIIPPGGPEILSTFEFSRVDLSYNTRTLLLRANNGDEVLLGAVQGSKSEGVLLYSAKYETASHTITIDKGLLLHYCHPNRDYNDTYSIAKNDHYPYLCAKEQGRVVQVGYIGWDALSGSARRDTELLNLCSDAPRYQEQRASYADHLTAAVCDIQFTGGIPKLILK